MQKRVIIFFFFQKNNIYFYYFSYRGIAFAAVHDSYWTHACTVDRLNELLRE